MFLQKKCIYKSMYVFYVFIYLFYRRSVPTCKLIIGRKLWRLVGREEVSGIFEILWNFSLNCLISSTFYLRTSFFPRSFRTSFSSCEERHWERCWWRCKPGQLQQRSLGQEWAGDCPFQWRGMIKQEGRSRPTSASSICKWVISHSHEYSNRHPILGL